MHAQISFHTDFGWLDGISQPAVAGFATSVLPGQSLIFPGTILVGEPGDTFPKRPTWARDGSFLAFRQLQQFVPEFGKFLNDNPVQDVSGSLSVAQGAELLGARMVGRWKGVRLPMNSTQSISCSPYFSQGAPIDLASWDDPVLGADPHQNNDFDFTHPGSNLASDQSYCPFAAHIRKTRPRADEQPENLINQIMRAGIPYGIEGVY
jgi:deferrochelatase/peroxidase EfeB